MCPATDDLRDGHRPRCVGRDSAPGRRVTPVDDEPRLEELTHDQSPRAPPCVHGRAHRGGRERRADRGAGEHRLVVSLGPTWLTIRTRPGNVIDRGGLTGRVGDRRHRSRFSRGLVGAGARDVEPRRSGRRRLPCPLRSRAMGHRGTRFLARHRAVLDHRTASGSRTRRVGIPSAGIPLTGTTPRSFTHRGEASR